GAAPNSLRRRGAARSARTRTEADASNGSGLYLGVADGEDGAGSAAHDALGDTAGHRARAPGPPGGAHHDEIVLAVCGQLENALARTANDHVRRHLDLGRE